MSSPQFGSRSRLIAEMLSIARHHAWLKPDFWDDAVGDLGARIQTWIVRTPATTVLIDTGVGNDKARPDSPAWHMREGAWLEDLAAAGLTPERVDEWEAGTVFFPSVRVDATTIIDLMQLDRTGQNVDHLCLVVDDDIEALAARADLVIEDGPAPRWGAQGNATSIYLRDPDGNLVELRRYPA